MKLARAASTVAVALLVLMAGAAATVAVLGERLLAAVIEKAGPALVGREVRVGGVEIEWGRRTTVAVADLTVADVAWTTNPAMLRAARAELTIDLLDLLRLRLSPLRLGLQQPALRLARDEQGRWNLPGTGTGDGTSGSNSFVRLGALHEMEIEGGELIVDDLASPGVEGRITSLSARLPRPADDIEFEGMVRWDSGRPLAFSGRAGSPAELLNSGDDDREPFPIQLTVGPETARLSAIGHLTRPLELAGVDLRIRAQGEDMAPLLATFAETATATPPLKFTAQLTDTEHGWSLQDVEARLGESRLRGKATASFGAGKQKPQLSLDFVVPRLVPSDFGWIASLIGGGEAAANFPARMQVPAKWLRRVDARGNLRVERLDELAIEPAGLHLSFKLDDGHLHIEPLRLEVAGSAVEGTATVNTAGEAPPRIALRMDANDLQLGPLLAAFGIDEITGTLKSATVDLRGRGATLHEVVAGLDGAVSFRIAEGNLDLPGLSHLSMGLMEGLGVVLGGSGGGAATPVACAVGDLSVRQGVARVERLAILIPQVLVTGEGSVRLSESTIRLTLIPRPLDDALFRVVVPVVISGKLAAPEVTKHPELRVGARPETAPDACGGADRR